MTKYLYTILILIVMSLSTGCKTLQLLSDPYGFDKYLLENRAGYDSIYVTKDKEYGSVYIMKDTLFNDRGIIMGADGKRKGYIREDKLFPGRYNITERYN